jgi:hypothetical protein
VNRARLADQIPRLAQQLDDLRARLGDRQVRQLVVGGLRPCGRATATPRLPERHRLERAVRLNDGAHRQRSSRHQMTSVRSPKVQIMAMPLPFSGSASGCAFTGTGTPKSGVITTGAEERLVARVVGMRHERHARRQQLGPRGVDLDERAVRLAEAQRW